MTGTQPDNQPKQTDQSSEADEVREAAANEVSERPMTAAQSGDVLFESMTKFEAARHEGGRWRIRVWRQEPSLQAAAVANDATTGTNKELWTMSLDNRPIDQIVTRLLGMPHVNAVEVLDTNGDGVVAYNNWP